MAAWSKQTNRVVVSWWWQVSDSGGGAGIQADIKTITVLGGYAATAITALTAQNTLGVFGVLPIDPDFVAEQMSVVLTDIGADAVKTGMLFSEAIISAVASTLEIRARRVPVIVDPVMVAKGGTSLLQERARSALVERLLPLAALITPNAPEAAALAGIKVETVDDMERAADRLLAFGASAVLIKGGHVPGDTIVDLLRTADGDGGALRTSAHRHPLHARHWLHARCRHRLRHRARLHPAFGRRARRRLRGGGHSNRAGGSVRGTGRSITGM